MIKLKTIQMFTHAGRSLIFLFLFFSCNNPSFEIDTEVLNILLSDLPSTEYSILLNINDENYYLGDRYKELLSKKEISLKSGVSGFRKKILKKSLEAKGYKVEFGEIDIEVRDFSELTNENKIYVRMSKVYCNDSECLMFAGYIRDRLWAGGYYFLFNKKQQLILKEWSRVVS